MNIQVRSNPWYLTFIILVLQLAHDPDGVHCSSIPLNR
jgi:hypothetical protein